MRLVCLLVIVHANLCAAVHLRDHGYRDPPEVSIQAFVVNLDQSEERLACMEGQLTSVAALLKPYGVTMSFARYPALQIKSSTLDNSFKSYPNCYPNKSLAPLEHPSDPGNAWKGVLANTCSHLELLEDLSARALQNQNDYYLILEDDVIFDIVRFALALKSYFELDQGHWSLLAFDTFEKLDYKTNPTFGFTPPEEDRIDGPLDLYLISNSWQYWGAHAWLVHGARVKQLWDHMRSNPTMPLDWYPKWSSQLHASFVSFQSGSVWQQKYAPPDKINTACAYNDSSDIIGAGKPRIGFSVSSTDEIIILGMYDSGTNLFTKMLQENIEKPLNIELCKNYSSWAYCGRVWKHTHPKRLSEAISLRPDYGDFSQSAAVVLVRHPFALINSLQSGENYDVHCGEPTGNKSVDITHRCVYVPPTGAQLQSQMGNERIKRPICPSTCDAFSPCDVALQCWGNVAEGWNSYIDGYLHDLTRLFKQVKIIRYEDLVQAPRRTMRELTKDVVPDIGPDWDWTPYEGASKNLGETRSDALQKFTEHIYGADFTEDEIVFLCSQLDKHLMGRLGYHGCAPAWNDVKNVSIRTIS